MNLLNFQRQSRRRNKLLIAGAVLSFHVLNSPVINLDSPKIMVQGKMMQSHGSKKKKASSVSLKILFDEYFGTTRN